MTIRYIGDRFFVPSGTPSSSFPEDVLPGAKLTVDGTFEEWVYSDYNGSPTWEQQLAAGATGTGGGARRVYPAGPHRRADHRRHQP